MNAAAELTIACDHYKQAQESVMLEKAAWEGLQQSYGTILRSLEKIGMSRVDAQKEFDAYMMAHATSFSAALKHLSARAAGLCDLLRRYPEVQLVRNDPYSPA